MNRTYGYCRISTQKQSIERQIRNIKESYPDAVLFTEAFTGTKMNRPEWNKMIKQVQTGDTIVFDSVSRMSRNATEGIETYMELFNKGVELVFLKEHHIDTATYKRALAGGISMTGTTVDYLLEGINNFLKALAAEQIKIAFEQAEKEVTDLHKRTAEGIETARRNGKQIGMVSGTKLTTKKSIVAKEIIRKHNKDFGGTLNDLETMQLTNLARNTYYKYKKELKEGETA